MDNQTSFWLALRPLVWTAQLYGFWPLRLDIVTSEVRISKFGLVYGSCLIISLAVYRFVDNLFLQDDNSIEKSIFRGSAVIESVFTASSYLSYVFHVKLLRLIFRRMFFYSKMIRPYPFFRNVFKILLGEVLVSMIIFQTYYAVYMYWDPEDFLENYIDVIIENYMAYGILIINLQFANTLIFFSQMLRIANNELATFLNWNKIFLVRSYVKVKEIKMKRLTLIAADEQNLAPLIAMYDNVCDASCLLEEAFGWSNVVSAAFTLIQTIQAFYYQIVIGQDSPVMLAFWLIHLILQEWFVLFSCEYFYEQTKKTGVLVHNLLANATDQRLKDQLQQFSLQLLHRKMKFKACGLFPLNFTLIYSIAGAVTTYLVILIQFQNAANSASANLARDLKDNLTDRRL